MAAEGSDFAVPMAMSSMHVSIVSEVKGDMKTEFNQVACKPTTGFLSV